MKIWDASTREEIDELPGHDDSVWSVAFSPDSKLLASGSLDDTDNIKLWNMSTRNLKATLDHGDKVRSVAFNHNSSILASGSEDTNITLWNLNTELRIRNLTGHNGWVWSVAFSPDGKLLASGSADNDTKIWTVSNGQEKHTLTGHTDDVRSVAFNPNGNLLASGSKDGNVTLWNVSDGSSIWNMAKHDKEVTSVSFNPNGTVLASGSMDNTVKLWSLDLGTVFHRVTQHESNIWSVAFSPDGSLVASGDADHKIKLWKANTGEVIRNLTGHAGNVWSLAFNPNGTLLASGSWDGLINIWNVSNGGVPQTLEPKKLVRSVAFSPNGSLLASGLDDGSIMLWDVNTGICLRNTTGHAGCVNSIAFSPNGSLLVSGSSDTNVTLWNVNTGASLRNMTGHAGLVYSVAFSPNGSLLASGSSDNNVTLWDVGTGNKIKDVENRGSSVLSVEFSPDGRLLATGSIDFSVRLWNVTTGNCLREMSGHSGIVSSIAFSPDGSFLVSGSGDSDAIIWKVATMLFKFGANASSLVLVDSDIALEINPDAIVSIGWDGLLLLPIGEPPSVRTPADYGLPKLHVEVKHRLKKHSRDYQFTVIKDFLDYDDDGMPNNWETEKGFNQLNHTDALDDPDNDNMNNRGEYGNKTDPFNPDTDGDAWMDGSEYVAGSNATDPNGPPTVSWLAEIVALNNTFTNISLWNWRINANESVVVSVEVWHNSSYQERQNDTFVWPIELDEGLNIITSRGYYDFAHNNRSSLFFVTLNTSKPTITLMSPEENLPYQSTISSPKNISIIVRGQIGDILYRWDDDSFQPVPSPPRITLPFSYGPHTLHIKATNELSNHEIGTFNFITDNNPPEIQVNGFEAEMSGKHDIAITADDDYGIDYIQIEISGNKEISFPNVTSGEEMIWQWDTKEKDDGVYYFRIYAFDNAGNEGVWPSVDKQKVRIDNIKDDDDECWELLSRIELIISLFVVLIGGASVLVKRKWIWNFLKKPFSKIEKNP
ncbi:MAG: hypothetical protein ACFFB3_09700 [Candidatus Hodarchaeota archaeon]